MRTNAWLGSGTIPAAVATGCGCGIALEPTAVDRRGESRHPCQPQLSQTYGLSAINEEIQNACGGIGLRRTHRVALTLHDGQRSIFAIYAGGPFLASSSITAIPRMLSHLIDDAPPYGEPAMRHERNARFHFELQASSASVDTQNRSSSTSQNSRRSLSTLSIRRLSV
jgi:hypothetical protein